MSATAPPIEALVVRVDARQCEVRLRGEVVPARMRGRLFEERSEDKVPVAVGDQVLLSEDGDGLAIETIQPRRNLFARRAAGEEIRRQPLAANVDQIVVVSCFGYPPFSSITTDRILVAASFHQIPAAIVLNKIDRGKKKTIDAIHRTYQQAGYPVYLTSATKEQGISELRNLLRDRTSVVYGLSGAGKSTLINLVQPGLSLKTGNVSKSLKSGRHTTTFARLYELEMGGAVVDTPGVRVFRPYGIPPHELRLHFPEWKLASEPCRFHSCTHREEPDCQIRALVEAGQLAESRYRSYQQVLQELEEIYGGTGRREPH